MNLKLPCSLKAILVVAMLLLPITKQSYGQEGTATLSLSAQANFSRQVQSVRAIKSSLSSAQKKLSSQLLRELPSKRLAFSRVLPRARISKTLNQMSLVDIDTQVTPQVLRLIAAVGGQVVSAFPQDNGVRANLTPSGAEKVAALPEVRFIKLAEVPVFVAAAATPTTAATPTATPTTVTSQGDIAHQANVARDTYKVRGAGIKVGVISDSVKNLQQSQQAGELGKVTVLSGQSGLPGTGEGTAMLEIIHDLAPDAQLYFATGDGGPKNMADNIRKLAKAGCKIIVDDLSYFDEPIFQEDIVSAAIREVSQQYGVLYFTSAGNVGNKTSGMSSYWEGNFVDGGKTNIYDLGGANTRLHKFGSSTFNEITAVNEDPEAAKYCLLQWSSPYYLAKDDYDLWLVDKDGSIMDLSANTQDGSTPPFESILTPPTRGCRIIITKFSGQNRYLSLIMNGGLLRQITTGSCRGHNAAEYAISVAAAAVSSDASGKTVPFNKTNVTEKNSSDGPRRLFYDPDGTAHNRVLQKPDMTAADKVNTSVPDFITFPGTSAAAPHAAAIAALAWSANPGLTASSIRAVLNVSAIDIMKPKTDSDSGVGIVMAPAAVRAALSLKPTKSSTPSGGNG